MNAILETLRARTDRKGPSRRQPPSGQPFVLPRVKHVPNKDGNAVVKFMYPWQIVKIRSPKDLALGLDHYAHPAPMMEGSNAIKTPAGMRYLVEWVYPTLRWYCKVYGHEIPEWLAEVPWAHGIKDGMNAAMFGPGPLEIREWREDKRRVGTRAG